MEFALSRHRNRSAMSAAPTGKGKSKSTLSLRTSVPDEYERCYFDMLNRRRWKQYANLGSVLDYQLQYKAKVTRCTQTNWNWAKMAERWRHAKIIIPHDLYSRPVAQSDSVSIAYISAKKKQLTKLRIVTLNDKIVDTSDLEYDPYNISSQYTHRSSSTTAKYIPPGMRDMIKTYARRWRLYTSSKSNTGTKRSMLAYPHISKQFDDGRSSTKSRKLPSLRTRRPIRKKYGRDYF